MIKQISLEANEKKIFELRELYDSYGYSHYKMSKFEEYGLYLKNKDFLVSEGVITFTDTNGKLMALKPDVTLSIVKNTLNSTNSIQKLYYNENVYRVSKSSHSFKEIMQVGLECIGSVDDYCICEVLKLALRSLDKISDKTVLDISNLDILVELQESIGVPESERPEILRLVSEKNIHELSKKFKELGIWEENTEIFKNLISISGSPEKVIPKLKSLLAGRVKAETVGNFCSIISFLADEKAVNIDFSLVDDISYYNGIVFKGFVDGIPSGVLSGGQYDKLMKNMKRSSKAIGFAVYLDMLEQLYTSTDEYDVDILLVYDSTVPPEKISRTADEMRSEGSVLAVDCVPEGIRCRKTVFLKAGGEVS